jgi:hypothetical protein
VDFTLIVLSILLLMFWLFPREITALLVLGAVVFLVSAYLYPDGTYEVAVQIVSRLRSSLHFRPV